MAVYDTEHENLVKHLDPEYRQMLEDHWKMLDQNQDEEDRVLLNTIGSYSRRAVDQPKTSVKQKLICMIDRILGKNQG